MTIQNQQIAICTYNWGAGNTGQPITTRRVIFDDQQHATAHLMRQVYDQLGNGYLVEKFDVAGIGIEGYRIIDPIRRFAVKTVVMKQHQPDDASYD